MKDFDDLAKHAASAAEMLKALASESRLQILCRLSEGERSVNDLAADCNLSQSAMSQQLKRLKDSDLVQTRREAQTIYYSLKGDEVATIIATLHAIYCKR